MRRRGYGIAGAPDVPDDLSSLDDGAVVNAIAERRYVRVVVLRPIRSYQPTLVAAENADAPFWRSRHGR